MNDQTSENRASRFARNFRCADMQVLAKKMQRGENGTIVGLPGIGRTTFLDYFFGNRTLVEKHLPSVEQPVIPLTVELNILPDNSLATLYRAILRTFYMQRRSFPQPFQHIIAQTYLAQREQVDAFSVQSDLLTILNLLAEQKIRTVLVLNHFAEFCGLSGTPEMMRTLRGLRDTYKRTLVFLVGTNTPLAYINPPEVIDPIRNLLDRNTYWLKPLCEHDAHHAIQFYLNDACTVVDDAQCAAIWQLSGGFPALIRMICLWRVDLDEVPNIAAWGDILLNVEAVRKRLTLIWHALTQVEQFALTEMSKRKEWPEIRPNKKQPNPAIDTLITKGIIIENRIFGSLFSSYVKQLDGAGRGRIYMDAETQEIYQGNKRVAHLPPQAHAIIKFFMQHPYQWHDHDVIINAAWDDDAIMAGVSTDAVYQQVRNLRAAIEPKSGRPVYIVNQKGGYRFYPEGRPAQNAG